MLNILDYALQVSQVSARSSVCSTQTLASGDVRNVVQSVLGLPEGYRSHSPIVLSDMDFDIVVCNFVKLSVALQCVPNGAAEMILHICYSARLPAKTTRAISTYILPLIEDVIRKINDKPWQFRTRSLRLASLKLQSLELVSKLAPLSAIENKMTDSNRQAVMLAPTRKDYLDRALLTQPERHRQCTVRFRETDVLLPFARDIRSYINSNPPVSPGTQECNVYQIR